MHRLQVSAILGTLLLASSCGPAPIEVDSREASEHQLFDTLRLYGVPAYLAEPFGTDLTLTVNEEGHVDTACIQRYVDEGYCRPLDARYLKDIRYRPFMRNGTAIAVKVRVAANLYPIERKPSKNIPFPLTDLSSLRIELWRSGCFGSCPSYLVSIDGKGNIVWSGIDYTVLSGRYRAKIPVGEVQRLVDMFAAANFYSLEDEYVARVTDNPSDIIIFSMGGRRKMIIDYVGLAVGMPKSVADLEAAIDATAGTERWVRGTPETVEILKKQNFNFKSKSAYEMLVEAVDRPAFFKALIAAGVPVTPDRSDGSSRPILSALTAAVSLGDREAFALLMAAGAAKNLPPAEADELLIAAAKNADPQLIKTVLALAPDSVFSAAAKVEALKEASGKHFDKHGAVAILLAAGADPNRLDVKGETVFDWISDPAIAAQIIAAGADLNRKNKSGLIPLLSNHNEETTLYLMKVTKPGIADPVIARALKKRAEQFEFKKVLAQLQRHQRALAFPR